MNITTRFTEEMVSLAKSYFLLVATSARRDAS